jgi:ligand-binding sensor domain-containing protein
LIKEVTKMNSKLFRKASTPFVLVLLVTACTLGTPQKAKGTWNTYTYTPEDVLSDINPIAVAPDGMVWVAGDSALRSFDGNDWTTYHYPFRPSLSNPIAVAPDGTVWGGAYDLVYSFDRENWTVFAPKNRPHPLACSDGKSRDLYYPKDGDSVACRTLDGNTTYAIIASDLPEQEKVNAISVASDGTVWIGYFGGNGISRFDGTRWTTYSAEVDYSLFFTVNSIAVAPNGTVWVGGRDVSSFNELGWTDFEAHSPGIGPAFCVAIANDGTVWAGDLGGGGVYRLDMTVIPTIIAPRASRVIRGGWTTFTEEDGLAHNQVTSIATAPGGVIWVDTVMGISRFDGKHWDTYTINRAGVAPSANSIAVGPDGTAWAAIGGGVARYSPAD